ncbi:hypothetical protein V494_07714 [Pseudogymnoascus sp. VKM F-4513 (FW-928)]|nr:hypothetical protein V494_07714 [Pseudogymnoascus sp. VKM F-4513 (FW-928)]
MSASSSAALTSLSRPRIAVVLVTVLASAYGIYYLHRSSDDAESAVDLTLPSGPGLHRTNAVRRRHRRPTPRTGDGAEDNPDSSQDESDDTDNESGPVVLRPLTDGETIVEDFDFDQFLDPPWDRQRAGQHMVQLLFRISEDATKRNAYVHRGTLCNACGVVPIRGIRYRCANCADYDLCESCESQGHHYRTHVFYKIRVPISNYAPRQLQSAFYPGDPDTAVKMLTRDLTTRLTRETGLDRPEIEAYWEQWTYMANTEWRDDPDGLYLAMDRRTFDRCLVPSDGNRYAAPNLIHDRMFAFYDQNNDDLISFPEYLQGLAFRKSKNKIRRVFDGYDINGDGYVDRKDFLRMFRSYYVLFKNMRKDMLDSMDEHAVNSVEAHQLVNSRQPLSSAFGRDGRFGRASNPRAAGEGKQPNPDGDLEIVDGKGIVNPSGDDHGDKADVFRDPLGRAMNDFPPDTSGNYWGVVSSPPPTLETLQSRVLENIMATRAQQENTPPESERPEDPELADEVDVNWPPGIVEPCDISEVLGMDVPFDQVPRSQRAKIIDVASKRVLRNAHLEQEAITNDRMHERWRRRQFYTDEEEGVEAPPDWKTEEDVPLGETKSEEAPQMPAPSPRSRSSSKVRFAEDMDDYETRSNPSTSSRSVPERWGGMEIPEAEKDAGKDVLYQVAQQAFNELLDNLFKNAEDAAIASLSSKKTRALHRHLFTNVYFEWWAERVDMSYAEQNSKESDDVDKKSLEAELARHIQKEIRSWNEEPTSIGVEIEETREAPLDALLAHSGYSIDDGTDVAEPGVTPDHDTAVHDGSSLESQSQDIPVDEHHRDLLEVLRGPIPDQTEPPLPTDEDEYTDLLQSYRDPTLPQFRPSAVSPPTPSQQLPEPQDTPVPTTETTELPHHEGSDRSNHERSRTSKRSGKAHRSRGKNSTESSTPKPAKPLKTPLRDLQKELLTEMKADVTVPTEVHRSLAQWDWMALYKLREMESTESDARMRGGWGRIGWAEFENIVRLRDPAWRAEKRELSEGSKPEAGRRIMKREQDVERMMEYLGSWIEMCIP